MPNINIIKKIARIAEDIQSFVFDESEKNEQEHSSFRSDIDILDNKIENKAMTPGPKGDTGPRGPQGDTGAPGRDGKSIVGPKGDKGEKGETGAPGRTPIKGKDYFDGKDGAVGPRGPRGPAGKDGKDAKQNFNLFSRATYPAVKIGENLLTTGVREFKFQDLNLDAFIYEGSKVNLKVSDTPTFDLIDFDLTAGVTGQEGRLYWNDNEKTLNLGMAGGDVSLQIGQELLIRGKASEDIANGQVVYISGGTGSQPIMSLADADIVGEARATIAVATEDITANQFGYFTTVGLVRDINTAAYSAGDMLYLSSTSGQVTSTAPLPPAYIVEIGQVIRSSATEGVIYVNINSYILPNYERHVQIPAFLAGTPANQPTPTTVGTAGGLQFGFAADKMTYVQWEVPDDWVGGEDIYIEVDWFPDATNIDYTGSSETVNFTVTYRSIAEGETITQGTAVAVPITSAEDLARYQTKHTRFTLDFDNANQPITKQDHIYFEIKRDVSEDTFNSTVVVTAFEIVYNSNRPASSN